MNCKETKKLMLEFIDGNLSLEKLSEMNEHVKVCAECSNEIKSIKQFYGLMEDEKSEFTFNPYFSAKVLSRISDIKDQKTILLSPMRYALIASLSAAAVFVGVMLGSVFSNVNSNFAQTQSNNSIELLAEEYFSTSSINIYDFQIDETENNK